MRVVKYARSFSRTETEEQRAYRLNAKMNSLPATPYRSMEMTTKPQPKLSKLESLFTSRSFIDQFLGYSLLIATKLFLGTKFFVKWGCIPLLLIYLNSLWIIASFHCPMDFRVWIMAIIPALAECIVLALLFDLLQHSRNEIIENAKAKMK
jgi:hypothetical protein